jgi:hypothetical protein
MYGPGICEADFPFCRVDVKVGKGGIYCYKYRADGMKPVWKIPLKAVFKGLKQREVLDAPIIRKNKLKPPVPSGEFRPPGNN